MQVRNVTVAAILSVGIIQSCGEAQFFGHADQSYGTEPEATPSSEPAETPAAEPPADPTTSIPTDDGKTREPDGDDDPKEPVDPSECPSQTPSQTPAQQAPTQQTSAPSDGCAPPPVQQLPVQSDGEDQP